MRGGIYNLDNQKCVAITKCLGNYWGEYFFSLNALDLIFSYYILVIKLSKLFSSDSFLNDTML